MGIDKILQISHICIQDGDQLCIKFSVATVTNERVGVSAYDSFETIATEINSQNSNWQTYTITNSFISLLSQFDFKRQRDCRLRPLTFGRDATHGSLQGGTSTVRTTTFTIGSFYHVENQR